jgi:hypothetical protein
MTRSKQPIAYSASQDNQEPQPALSERRRKTKPRRHRQAVDWETYERLKSALALRPLLPDEYDAAIRVLVGRLGL